MEPRIKKEIQKDGLLFFISVCVAIALLYTNTLSKILAHSALSSSAASFISGIFFTSIFTTAPAAASLAQIAHAGTPWQTAFFGSLGSVLGDLFIFRFVRDNVSKDFEFLFDEIKNEKRWLKIHHRWKELQAFKWLVPLLGAIIIASPLPDEIGLTILGLSKIKMRWFLPLTFILNFFGILLLAYVGKMWL